MQLWNSAFCWDAGNDVLQTTFTHRRASGWLAPLPGELDRLRRANAGTSRTTVMAEGRIRR